MATEKFANKVGSVLTVALGGSPEDTALEVLSATGFPEPQFRVVVGTEIMLVTGVAGSVFTIVRGYEGTPITSHNAGAEVRHCLTAGALEQLKLDMRVLNGLGSPEGIVVAEVGTLYLRLDGGVGTTLWVKESGSGNIGWAAK